MEQQLVRGSISRVASIERRVFNTKRSGDWKHIEGAAIDIQNDVVILENWSDKEGDYVREGITNYLQTGQMSVTNLSQRTALGVKADWKIDGTARWVDRINWRGREINLYDYGRFPTQAEIDAMKLKLGYNRTNIIARTNAVGPARQ